MKITIGDITAGPTTYTSNFNMKRGAPGQSNQLTGEKSKVSWQGFQKFIIKVMAYFIWLTVQP